MDGVTCTGRGFQVKRLKSLAGWVLGVGVEGGVGSDVYEWRLQVEQLKSLAGWVGG